MTQIGKIEAEEDVIRTSMLYFFKTWREKIHVTVKKLCEYNGINWLPTQMYYHILQNLGELIKGDLLGKLQKGLELK